MSQYKDSTIKNQIGEFQDIQSKKPSEIAMMNEIKRLKSETVFLNNINTRIGKELVKCQAKLGIQPGKQPLMGDYNDMKEKASMYNAKTGSFQTAEISYLEPLLLAYDDKLEKMESMLSTVYEDVKEMEKKSETLIEENVFLRNELETKCESLMQMHKNGVTDDNMATAFQKLEQDDLKERLYLMTEENKELLEKYKEIANKYNIMKVTLESKIKDHDETYKNYLEQTTLIKNLEIEVENAKNMRTILENKIRNYSENIAQQETEKNEISQKLSRSLNEIKLLKSQAQNMKKQTIEYEERKTQELEMMAKEYDQLKLKERENFNKVIFMERELDQSKEQNRKIKKDLEQSKNDCDQMIRMMENYENKVESYQKKEENIIKLAKEQREKVQEAQLEKDKAQLKEQQLEKALQNITEQNREDMAKQKEQYDKIIENIRNKNKSMLEQRDQELKEIQDQLMELQLNTEKQNREFTSLKAENQKLQTFLKEDLSGQHDQQISDYERRVNELEEKLQLTDKFNQDRIHSLTLEKQQAETQFKNLSNTHIDLKTQFEQTRNQHSQLSSELQGTKSRLNAAVREKQNVLDEISKIKKHYETKMEYGQEEYNNKLRDLQEQNQASINREKASRQKAIQLLQDHDKAEEKLRFDYESKIQELQAYIVNIKTQNKQLNNKYQRAQQELAPQKEFH